MTYETLITVCGIVAAICYFIATIASIKKNNKLINIWMVGWVFNFAIFFVNWYVSGHPPFAQIYHVLTVLGLCFMPFEIYFEKRFQLIHMKTIFLFGTLIPILGVVFMEKQLDWQIAPALQSIWFIPHVFAYMIAYSMATVSFLALCIAIYKQKKNQDSNKWEETVYQVCKFAFPFFTFGMLSGAVWAEEAWGNYWTWDIKETWALITWMLYLLYFHYRPNKKNTKYANIAHILAFLALWMTFLGVSYLPIMSSSIHSYI